MVGTVQIGYGGEIALRAVGVVVAPETLVRGVGGLLVGASSTVGVVPYGVDGGTRLSVEDGQIFRTLLDEAVTATVYLRIAVAFDGGISGCLVHVLSLAVHTARGCLADQFGLAVTVKIVYQILSVVGTGADILAQVNAPEFCAVQSVAVDNHIVGDARLRVVL